MQEAETVKSKKEGFFSISVDVIEKMIFDHCDACDANVTGTLQIEEFLAYICLSRGAGPTNSSRWTENGISKHTGMTYTRAERACTYLVDHGYIVKNKDHVPVRAYPSKKDKNISSNAARKVKTTAEASIDHKYILTNRPGINSIFLPNKIVDVSKTGRAFFALGIFSSQIFSNLKLGISSSEARLDTMILFLLFNFLQDLHDHGGLPSYVWYRTWRPVRDGHGLGDSSDITCIDNTDFYLNEIEQSDVKFGIDNISESFEYISCIEERKRRIENALESLFKVGLVYEVLQVWSRGKEAHSNIAELEYPLYVFDAAQRKSGEPSLARKVNELAFNIYPSEQVFLRGEEFNFNNKFRFLSHDHMHFEARSALRLRYRPQDHDCGLAMRKQANLVTQWEEVISGIKKETVNYE